MFQLLLAFCCALITYLGSDNKVVPMNGDINNARIVERYTIKFVNF